MKVVHNYQEGQVSAVKTSRPNGHDAKPGIGSTLNGSRSHKHALLESVSYACIRCDAPVSAEKFAALATEDLIRLGEIEAEIRAKLVHERDAEIAKIKGDVEKAANKQAELFVNREKALMDKLQADRERLEKVAKQAVEKAKKEAEKSAAAKVEALVSARLEAQRETHEKAVNVAVLAERAKYLSEKLALEGQLQDMQRRLQAKTAHQLGEPAEVELAAALETAFPTDKVWRVVKGVRGPDVVVEVTNEGAAVGKIVLDSKNHKTWQNKFTAKLRADQLAEKADYAILSSSVFPAGEQQLAIRDNVIVASPQRVIVLVHLLRRQIIQSHMLKLSAEGRSQKADELYAYILSPTCSDLMDRIVKLTDDMAALEQTETTAHQKVWSKRADLIRAIVDIHGEFTGSVSAIVMGEAA
jgi:hypothetical protein